MTKVSGGLLSGVMEGVVWSLGNIVGAGQGQEIEPISFRPPVIESLSSPSTSPPPSSSSSSTTATTSTASATSTPSPSSPPVSIAECERNWVEIVPNDTPQALFVAPEEASVPLRHRLSLRHPSHTNARQYPASAAAAAVASPPPQCDLANADELHSIKMKGGSGVGNEEGDEGGESGHHEGANAEEGVGDGDEWDWVDDVAPDETRASVPPRGTPLAGDERVARGRGEIVDSSTPGGGGGGVQASTLAEKVVLSLGSLLGASPSPRDPGKDSLCLYRRDA